MLLDDSVASWVASGSIGQSSRFRVFLLQVLACCHSLLFEEQFVKGYLALRHAGMCVKEFSQARASLVEAMC